MADPTTASSWDSIPPPGEVASAERRFIGHVIDSLVLVPATFVLPVLLVGSGHGNAFGRRALAMTVVAAYNVVGVGRWGRTLGKRLMGTRVVAAGTGRPPGWSPAVVRSAVQAAPGIVALAWIWSIPLVLDIAISVVVYVGVLRDPRRQGLHDKAADTLVVTA